MLTLPSTLNRRLAAPDSYERIDPFIEMLGKVMSRLGSHRVQIGWSPCDGVTPEVDERERLKAVRLGQQAGLEVGVSMAPAPFARASALNVAVAAARPEDLVVALDVDMVVSHSFFLAAGAFTRRGVSAYFPVVWSEYNPAGVDAYVGPARVQHTVSDL